MVYPLLSYVQIRVSVIVSLGYRFSIAGLWSLGVTLEVGLLVFLYPTVIPFPVVGGFVLWFLLLLVGRTWTNLSYSAVSIFVVLAIVGPRACHSLGVAWFLDPYGVYCILLWFGSVSLSLDLGFEFRPLLCWLSISGLGFQFRWVYAVDWPDLFPESLSL